jgi:hypothetical protein
MTRLWLTNARSADQSNKVPRESTHWPSQITPELGSQFSQGFAWPPSTQCPTLLLIFEIEFLPEQVTLLQYFHVNKLTFLILIESDRLSRCKELHFHPNIRCIARIDITEYETPACLGRTQVAGDCFPNQTQMHLIPAIRDRQGAVNSESSTAVHLRCSRRRPSDNLTAFQSPKIHFRTKNKQILSDMQNYERMTNEEFNSKNLRSVFD